MIAMKRGYKVWKVFKIDSLDVIDTINLPKFKLFKYLERALDFDKFYTDDVIFYYLFSVHIYV